MKIERLDSMQRARDPWEALATRTGRIFSTWDWADAWWGAFGDTSRLELHLVHDDQHRRAALLPLYRRDWSGPPILRMIGHGVGDELGPLCADADAPLAARALKVVARRLPAHGMILVDRLRGDDPLLAELPDGRVREEGAPVLVRDGRTWEDWLARRSSNFRQQLRRRERALLRDHGLRYRLSDDPDRLDEDLTILIELHRARWANGDSAAFTPMREAFHRDFARRAFERGWLRLWLAEADGKTVAAWYGFRYGGTETYYQAGRDPAWNRTAVGMVLLAHTIREAFGDGVEQYCFGVGDEPYKSRFTALDPGLRSVLVGRSATRLAGVAVAGGLTWLPSKARQRLTRRVA